MDTAKAGSGSHQRVVGTTTGAEASDLSAGAGPSGAAIGGVDVTGTSALTVGVVSGAGEADVGREPCGSVVDIPSSFGADTVIDGNTRAPMDPAVTGTEDAAGPAGRVATSGRSDRVGDAAAVLTNAFSDAEVDWSSTSRSVGSVGCVGPF